MQRRVAKALLERARAQAAAALGAEGADIVFTSGATEAAALACAGRGLACAAVEHEAVAAWCEVSLPVDHTGAAEGPHRGVCHCKWRIRKPGRRRTCRRAWRCRT